MAEAGKVAIITGAGSGIGRAAALALLKHGYRVVVAGRRQDKLQETIARAGIGSDRVLAVIADITKSTDVAGIFVQAKAAFGRIDVVFNNAGISAPRALF